MATGILIRVRQAAGDHCVATGDSKPLLTGNAKPLRVFSSSGFAAMARKFIKRELCRPDSGPTYSVIGVQNQTHSVHQAVEILKPKLSFKIADAKNLYAVIALVGYCHQAVTLGYSHAVRRGELASRASKRAERCEVGEIRVAVE